MHNWETLSRQLQSQLDLACAKNEECGCQLSLYVNGENVIDIAAGSVEPGGNIAVTPEHLFPVFSCGKALLAAAVLQSVDRGIFNLNTPLAEFWREFAVNGKSSITVEHILSHRAGLYILPRLDSDDTLADWDKMCSLIAGQTPRNPAGKNVSIIRSPLPGWREICWFSPKNAP